MLFNLLAVAAEALQGSVPPQTPDYRLELAAAITALTPIVVRLLVWASFFVVDKIPKWALPTAAVAIASVLDYFTGLTTSDPVLAAAVALATVGLREIIDRYFTQPLGLDGLFTHSDVTHIRRKW